MSSNRNAMNHNLFRGYQQYVEHHRQTFPFATPPSYQEWNATFFGAITPSPTSSLSSSKILMYRRQATTILFCHHHLCHHHQPVKMWRERTKIRETPRLIQRK